MEKNDAYIKAKHRASTRLILAISLITGLTFAGSILGINSLMRMYARKEAT